MPAEYSYLNNSAPVASFGVIFAPYSPFVWKCGNNSGFCSISFFIVEGKSPTDCQNMSVEVLVNRAKSRLDTRCP